MSDAFSGITFRVIQALMPEYHLPDDLLNGVMATLLLPPADATAARRRGRPARIIEEISWRGAGRVSGRVACHGAERPSTAAGWRDPGTGRRLVARGLARWVAARAGFGDAAPGPEGQATPNNWRIAGWQYGGTGASG
jgi:hypothetical protein